MPTASSKIVSLGGRQARLPHSVWWKTLEKAYHGEVADIVVHWSSESTSFLERVGLTSDAKSVLAFFSLPVKPNAGSSSLW